MPKENTNPNSEIKIPTKEEINKIFWQNRNVTQKDYGDVDEEDLAKNKKQKTSDSNLYGEDD